MSIKTLANTKIYLLLVAGFLVVASVAVSNIMAHPQTATASASDYFLKIEGIDGSSTDASHKGTIEVLSWSFGASNSSVGHGAGGMGSGTGKVSQKGFTITKQLDKSSPLLFKANVSGKAIKDMSFTGNIVGSQEYFVVHLSNVLVSSYSMSGDQGDRPMETVSFTYQKIEVTWPKSVSSEKSTFGAATENTNGSTTGTIK